MGPRPDPEVRPGRQSYPAAYKLKVLAKLDAADSKSARGEIMRREGLYSSLISAWRDQRDQGPRALDWSAQEVIAVGTFDAQPALLSFDIARGRSALSAVSQDPRRLTFGVSSLSAGSLASGVFAACDDGSVRAVDGEDPSSTVRVAGRSGGSLVNAVDYNRGASLLAWGGFDGRLYVEEHPGDCPAGWLDLGSPVNDLAWSGDGSSLLAACYDGYVRVVRAGSAGLDIEASVRAHAGACKAVRWLSSDAMVTCGTDDKVRIIGLDGIVHVEMVGHGNLVNSVAVSDGGALVASASRDKTVRVWEAATGTSVAVMMGHDASVKSVAWRPGSSTILVSGSYDFDVRVWDVARHADEQAAAAVLAEHRSGVAAVVWLSESTFVTGAWDATLGWWRYQDDGAPRLVGRTRLDGA